MNILQTMRKGLQVFSKKFEVMKNVTTKFLLYEEFYSKIFYCNKRGQFLIVHLCVK